MKEGALKNLQELRNMSVRNRPRIAFWSSCKACNYVRWGTCRERPLPIYRKGTSHNREPRIIALFSEAGSNTVFSLNIRIK